MFPTRLGFRLVGTILAILLLLGGVFVYRMTQKPEEVAPTVDQEVPAMRQQQIGQSVQGRPITAYVYGTGSTTLMFVGGMHGGYEWNSTLLAYTFMDYLTTNPTFVPSHLSLVVIPSANPDALVEVVGTEGRFTAADASTNQTLLASARFNARDVDLNRNFDCKWQPTSTWRSQEVSAGTAPFSEPEAQAIRFAVTTFAPSAVVFWHSQANAVYASECHGGVLPTTRTLMQAYADAAGYTPVSTFDAYPISGDAEGWLASINIPAITVELATHEHIEWEQNLAGIQKILTLF